MENGKENQQHLQDLAGKFSLIVQDLQHVKELQSSIHQRVNKLSTKPRINAGAGYQYHGNHKLVSLAEAAKRFNMERNDVEQLLNKGIIKHEYTICSTCNPMRFNEHYITEREVNRFAARLNNIEAEATEWAAYNFNPEQQERLQEAFAAVKERSIMEQLNELLNAKGNE